MEFLNGKTKTTLRPVASTRCLAEACTNLSIPYDVLDDFGNWICIHLDREYHFVNSRTPFNTDATSVLCEDKSFLYRYVSTEIQMPETISYMTPYSKSRYREYCQFDSVKRIAMDIEQKLGFPAIIKMNRGLRGHNVFRVRNIREAKRALTIIFNPKKRYFDYVAIAQKEIFIHKEYRAILFRGECLLLYEKRCGEKRTSLSPLHNEGAQAVHIPETDSMYAKVTQFLHQSSKVQEFEFVGADVVVDHEGTFWLLELNTYPGFTKFTADNGDEYLVQMYEKILDKMRS